MCNSGADAVDVNPVAGRAPAPAFVSSLSALLERRPEGCRELLLEDLPASFSTSLPPSAVTAASCDVCLRSCC